MEIEKIVQKNLTSTTFSSLCERILSNYYSFNQLIPLFEQVLKYSEYLSIFLGVKLDFSNPKDSNYLRYCLLNKSINMKKRLTVFTRYFP